MSKKKKILIGLGIFISLILIWRVNAMMNTKMIDPNKTDGGKSARNFMEYQRELIKKGKAK